MIRLSADQVIAVVSWLLVLTMLQLSVYPVLKKTFGGFAFPVAFPASVMLFTVISWYLGLARLPMQLAIVPFLALLAWNLYDRRYTVSELKSEWLWETVFLVCFLLMLDVRFVNPTISYAEKFMDHAFLASVIRNPVVPPLDPWFAGGTLNVYYYLGYWIFSCPAIVSGVPSNIAFNLALPTVFALAAVTLYAASTLMLNRFRWLPLLIFFLPNPSFFYQALEGKTLNSIMWDSTRTITNTINEYPLFSFTWGDVHAHVVSIFNQLFLIFLLIFACSRWEALENRGKWMVSALAALGLGAMPLINTWDVLIYAPIVVLFGLLILIRGRKQGRHAGSCCEILGAVPPLAILSFLPFYLQLQTHTGGVAVVHTPSDPAQFLLVNGFFIAVFYAVLGRDMIKRPYLALATLPFAIAGYVAAAVAMIPLVYFIARKRQDLPGLLAMIGLAILVICEILYLRDNMGETYFRMNTVFKCYLPAWLLLGTAACTIAGRWLVGSAKIPVLQPRYRAAITVLVVCTLFALPFVIQYNLGFAGGSLDGLEYVRSSHPGDAGGVSFLRSLPGNEVLIEAEGGDYSYYSRVSSFTGIPSVIGMPFHEFMWRGNDTGWFGTRQSDIRTAYENPGRTTEIMRKYNVTLLYVGDAEREKYRVNLPADGLVIIYSAGGTDIYRPGP